MHKTHLLVTIILCSLVGTLQAATPPLTVVAVVNGLDQDNLNALRNYWQQGGIRTLSEEAYQTTIGFDQWIYGGSEAVATLMTGCYPNDHGISSDACFSRSDRTAHPILEDKQESGIGCNERWSPRALLASTLSDRLRMHAGTQAKIYAVGIHPTTTILLAGHSANACCWLQTEPLRWSTTSFYRDGLPSAADQMNVNGKMAAYEQQAWTPRMEIGMYMHPTEKEKKHPFSYSGNAHLLTSPIANTAVIDLALQLQQTQQLGQDATPDLLLLELTCLSPMAKGERIESAEQEDMYLWLNQDLGYLIEQLNKRIGNPHYQILVVGLPALGNSAQMQELTRMEVKQFNVDQAAALTSTYLMAIYGHERWVDGGWGQGIYLNRTLIEQKRMSLEEIQRNVSLFLMEFEGVKLACPTHEAYLNEDMRQSINKRSAGDVVYTLQPGWQLCNNKDSRPTPLFDTPVQVPLLFWSGSHYTFPQGSIQATDINQLLNL